jgi:beta-glucosidase
MNTNTIGWDICPDALYWGARFFHERYGLPIVITENGIPQTDLVVDGKVEDTGRIAFVSAYLRGLKRAILEGVPVHGYFYWSLMDNFEWASGYKQRFGMIHVDYATQRRTLKQSALWYREVIRSNGASLR